MALLAKMVPDRWIYLQLVEYLLHLLIEERSLGRVPDRWLPEDCPYRDFLQRHSRVVHYLGWGIPPGLICRLLLLYKIPKPPKPAILCKHKYHLLQQYRLLLG